MDVTKSKSCSFYEVSWKVHVKFQCNYIEHTCILFTLQHMYVSHVGMTCDLTCSLCRAWRMHHLCTCSPHICTATIALFVFNTSAHVKNMWYPHDGSVRLHKCNICKHTTNALAPNIFHYPYTIYLHIWGTCAINMFAMSGWTSVTSVYDWFLSATSIAAHLRRGRSHRVPSCASGWKSWSRTLLVWTRDDLNSKQIEPPPHEVARVGWRSFTCPKRFRCCRVPYRYGKCMDGWLLKPTP